MTGFARAARTSDFGWMEILPAIVLLAALFFGGDWASDAANETDAERAYHGQALSLAMSGSNALMDVDFAALEPTTGFVPVPAELVATAPTADDEHGYAVEMRISDLDIDGRLRRVEVRVGYAAEGEERIWVGTTTVRQDWAASHARSTRPSATGRV